MPECRAEEHAVQPQAITGIGNCTEEEIEGSKVLYICRNDESVRI